MPSGSRFRVEPVAVRFLLLENHVKGCAFSNVGQIGVELPERLQAERMQSVVSEQFRCGRPRPNTPNPKSVRVIQGP